MFIINTIDIVKKTSPIKMVKYIWVSLLFFSLHVSSQKKELINNKMTIKSPHWKQPSFQTVVVKNHNRNSYLNPTFSHSSGPSVRTRMMGRKRGWVHSNSSVIFLKLSLFTFIFMFLNFPHASFSIKHDHSNHNLRHSSHQHRHQDHHHHHLNHRHSEGGIRTCSHRPPKPEEVRHIINKFHCSHTFKHWQKYNFFLRGRKKNRIDILCFHQLIYWK